MKKLLFTLLLAIPAIGFSARAMEVTFTNEPDYGIGIIEKGVNGKLWIAGNNTFSNLLDNNNPQSTFSIGPMNIINNLTIAAGYSELQTPALEDEFKKSMYLLVDQIDGEDYSSWSTGSDLFSSNIDVCSYPFSFPTPANAIISFTGQMSGTPSNIVIESDGILTISHVYANGCKYTETIVINERQGLWCPADFSWKLTSHGIDSDVQVDALCKKPLISSHEFYLYELDNQGVWQLIDSCVSNSCTLSGISSGHSYKIEHIVHNTSFGSHPTETSTQIITF